MKTLFTSIALALSLASLANAHPSAQAGISQPIKSTISQIKNLDGLNLHLQKDLPNSKPKAVVLVSHGFGEPFWGVWRFCPNDEPKRHCRVSL
ncbi:TPA: hypothetical protein ACU21S_001943 [Mannheimia haemolytica]